MVYELYFRGSQNRGMRAIVAPMNFHHSAPEIAVCPPVKEIRRRTGLPCWKVAAVMGVTGRTIFIWEKRGVSQRLLWLIYLTYLAPDPVNGWRRAYLGLPPTGGIPAELAQVMHARKPKTVEVAGYQRRQRSLRRIARSSDGRWAKAGGPGQPAVPTSDPSTGANSGGAGST